MFETVAKDSSALLIWLWLLLSIPPLLVLRRWISIHTQMIMLLITRHEQMAILLNQLIFLPGVILHEASHWMMAKLVGARLTGMSIWPARQPDGSLRLGYVQTERVDFMREALIGIAPLLAGCTAVGIIGYSRLGIGSLGTVLASGNIWHVFRFIKLQMNSADLLIWLYLLFALSNTMLPSASDWRAWPAVGTLLAAIALCIYLAGAEHLVEQALGEILASGVIMTASAFTITIALDLVIAPIVFVVEWLLWQVSGKKVRAR